MIPPDFFTRIPPASALLVFATLFTSSTTSAHALPRQTKTIPYHELNVRSWPLDMPMPTAASAIDDILQPRQLNTVCGYVGGDPDLPATCSAGSHCVVDTDHGAIGCCPDGGPCSSGVFTDCVDANSGPQTERNPYVHTCSGSDVCYQNQFGDGLFQYGCGSASSIAATVQPTASGKDNVVLSSLSVELTEEPSSLSEPTTLGTRTATQSSSETSETETETETDTESETTATETTNSETGTETGSSSTAGPTTTGSEDEMEGGDGDQDEDNDEGEAPDEGGNDTPTGPIVGGTIGGIAFLALTITLGLYLWRRKKGNTREGPGGGPDREYISSPMADGRHPFSPLHAVPEADETRLAPNPPPIAAAFAPNTESQYSQDQRHHHHPNMTTSAFYSSDSSGDAFGGGSRSMDQDRTPLTSDMPRFQNEEYRGGGSSHAGPVEPTPAASIGTAVSSDDPYHEDLYDQYPGPRRGGGSGALWQQNRKQNRNLTWM